MNLDDMKVPRPPIVLPCVSSLKPRDISLKKTYVKNRHIWKKDIPDFIKKWIQSLKLESIKI